MRTKLHIENIHILNPDCSGFFQGNMTIEGSRIQNIEPSGSSRISGHNIRESSSRIEASGLYAIPSFWDCHIHLFGVSRAKEFLLLEGLPLDRVISRVEKAATLQKPGSWIRGRGWEVHQFPDQRFPTRFDLDACSGIHPTALTSKDGHTLWLNTTAIQELGIEDLPVEISGSSIHFDVEIGYPSGILQENAADIALRKIPKPSRERMNLLIDQAIDEIHRYGITHVHTFEEYRNWAVLNSFEGPHSDLLDIVFHFDEPSLGEVLENGFEISRRNVSVGGLKLFADGALGSRSALVKTSYDGEPDNYGICVLSAEEMLDRARKAARGGYPCAIHAIGDQAVSNALFALADVRRLFPGLKNLRIEHCQLIDPQDIRKFIDLGVIASVQPCHMDNDIEMADSLWRRQTSLRYPYRSFQNNQIPLIFGSDAPIEKPNPWASIQMAVTRMAYSNQKTAESWYPEEKISLSDALAALTKTPSGQMDCLMETGVLQAGYRADVQILDTDPFQKNPASLHTIRPVFLMHEGRIVYDIERLIR